MKTTSYETAYLYLPRMLYGHLCISGSTSHNIYSLSFYTQPTTGVLAQWQA